MTRYTQIKTLWFTAIALLLVIGTNSFAGASVSGHGHEVGSEQEFLVEMIPHHQEAVDSARLLLAVTQRQELRDFAQLVIDGQSGEISMMREWLALWYPETAVQAAYRPMMRDFQNMPTDEAERMFLEDMIAHHQAAVHMARTVLDKDLSTRTELKELAQAIIDAQDAEISQMQEWLTQWYPDSGSKTEHNH